MSMRQGSICLECDSYQFVNLGLFKHMCMSLRILNLSYIVELANVVFCDNCKKRDYINIIAINIDIEQHI